VYFGNNWMVAFIFYTDMLCFYVFLKKCITIF
jgi:hypothetical protein